jgi:hypothetical protein
LRASLSARKSNRVLSQNALSTGEALESSLVRLSKH